MAKLSYFTRLRATIWNSGLPSSISSEYPLVLESADDVIELAYLGNHYDYIQLSGNGLLNRENWQKSMATSTDRAQSILHLQSMRLSTCKKIFILPLCSKDNLYIKFSFEATEKCAASKEIR
jgi:hypothetical protein